MRLSEVNQVATSRIRKYDWTTKEYEDGSIRITVTDGQEDASVVITTDENIESEIDRLIKAVDKHEYEVED